MAEWFSDAHARITSEVRDDIPDASAIEIYREVHARLGKWFQPEPRASDPWQVELTSLEDANRMQDLNREPSDSEVADA